MIIVVINGEKVLVDSQDLHLINKHKWAVYTYGGGLKYATAPGEKTLYLHREIMQAERGQYVDHINRNGLDNRRCNLRIVGQRKNIANAGEFQSNTSGYRGVISWRGGYRAQTKYRYNGKQYFVASRKIDDIILSAMIRDEMMRQMHGKTVFENLPGVPPTLEALTEATRIVDRLWERVGVTAQPVKKAA